ncbi:hypothetical protein K2173_010557 [Erythroxylum novogranatense]|uniref:Uncharacterized protein n=1 Tax=Erythroxylum novogranatense TaxID=1862640 RepID=A0AAV8TGB4_9ROSI|nr:hypothetical protein K2173_010557 [Erythroxylum novogranatense]
MAVPKIHLHARSNSLPSRPHPVISQLDEHVGRIKDSQATSMSTSIGQKLCGLQDLYDSVDDLLLLPATKKVLMQERHKKYIDGFLDGSLRILDVCNTVKDALSQTKESINGLQSVIRRRQGGLDSEIRQYISERKVVKKAICKTLKNLKGMVSNCTFISVEEVSEIANIISLLRDVEETTLVVLEFLLSFISVSKPQSRARSWLLVRLMRYKRVASLEEDNEFASADAALESLISSKASKTDKFQVEVAKHQLKSTESCIQDLEEHIEGLFRRMIKARVSFLNIFN